MNNQQIITAADTDFEYFKGSKAALSLLSIYPILPRRAQWRIFNKPVFLLVSVVNAPAVVSNSTRSKFVLDPQSSTKFWVEQEDLTYYFSPTKASFLVGVIRRTVNKIRLSRRADTRLQQEKKAASLGISHKRFMLNNRRDIAERDLKQKSGQKINLLVEMTGLRNKLADTIERVSTDTFRYEYVSIEEFGQELSSMLSNLVHYSHQTSTAFEKLIKIDQELARLTKEENQVAFRQETNETE
ncbi:MAG: hypothetical protein WC761_01340 [Candidatus Paceibacterota bacterium]|jgi:hypothetical protein